MRKGMTGKPNNAVGSRYGSAVCDMGRSRENWIDHVKVFACVLVALGHFFQSMCSCGASVVIFLALSFAEPDVTNESELFGFIMGVLACTAVVLIFCRFGDKSVPLASYTMPVFLMHTIFAAGLRAVLLKLGITIAAVHVILGLIASFAGPVIAAEIMKKLKLDILYQPGKYIKINK